MALPGGNDWRKRLADTTNERRAAVFSSSTHGFVECVPLPARVAGEAPMYFKKAIDESESEWSTHAGKRCLSTAPPKSLRSTIPENFPYFHAEFNMRGGFAHVVDDETRWNKKFRKRRSLRTVRFARERLRG